MTQKWLPTVIILHVLLLVCKANNTEKVHLKTIPQHSPMPSRADILLSKLVFDFSSFGKQNNAMQLTKKKEVDPYTHTLVYIYFLLCNCTPTTLNMCRY